MLGITRLSVIRTFLALLIILGVSYAAEDGSAAKRLPGRDPVLIPVIDGEWWQVAGDPDLGEFTSANQQPVDFGVWQAADGTWQLWSCIRKTKCGGKTRLFYRWQGEHLTDKDWKPIGIAMQADTALGEEKGGLQAPHMIKVGKIHYMFYGDWNRICLAKSSDGKSFARVLNKEGEPNLFAGPYPQTRDPMVLAVGGKYYCYYTGHTSSKGADFCRISQDLRSWSKPTMVAFGGRAGEGPWSAECPHVVYRKDLGLYYLSRTQRYGKNNISSIYASPDPLKFGVNDDRYFIGTLAVAAPEIVKHNEQYYIAALLPSLKGVRIAKLKWVAVEKK